MLSRMIQIPSAVLEMIYLRHRSIYASPYHRRLILLCQNTSSRSHGLTRQRWTQRHCHRVRWNYGQHPVMLPMRLYLLAQDQHSPFEAI